MMMWEVHQADCLEYMRTLPDASIDAVICDPPYGTTACKWDSVMPFAPMWEQLKRVAKPRAAIVLFGSQPFTSALVMSNPTWFRYEWAWDKGAGSGYLQVKRQPLRTHENLCVFYAEQPIYHPQMTWGKPNHSRAAGKTQGSSVWGERVRTVDADMSGLKYPRSVLTFAKHPASESLHPTQKPVALMEYLIRTYTNEGDTVLDFTCGSGSTGVACVNTGRYFIGIEKEPEYVAIARRRINEAAAQPRLEGIA